MRLIGERSGGSRASRCSSDEDSLHFTRLRRRLSAQCNSARWTDCQVVAWCLLWAAARRSTNRPSALWVWAPARQWRSCGRPRRPSTSFGAYGANPTSLTRASTSRPPPRTFSPSRCAAFPSGWMPPTAACRWFGPRPPGPEGSRRTHLRLQHRRDGPGGRRARQGPGLWWPRAGGLPVGPPVGRVRPRRLLVPEPVAGRGRQPTARATRSRGDPDFACHGRSRLIPVRKGRARSQAAPAPPRHLFSTAASRVRRTSKDQRARVIAWTERRLYGPREPLAPRAARQSPTGRRRRSMNGPHRREVNHGTGWGWTPTPRWPGGRVPPRWSGTAGTLA